MRKYVSQVVLAVALGLVITQDVLSAPVDTHVKDSGKKNDAGDVEKEQKIVEGKLPAKSEPAAPKKEKAEANKEILEPPRISKRQSPVLADEENMADEGEAPSYLDDEYLKELFSDPQVVQELLEEERRLQMLEALAPQVDLRPSAMAEYLLGTGDMKGVANMVDDLVAYGAMSEEEGREYRLAVEAEYSALLSASLKEGQAFPDGPAPQEFHEQSPEFPSSPVKDGQKTPVSFDGKFLEPDEDYYAELIKQSPFYDDILKEIITGLIQEESENDNQLPSNYNPGFPLVEDDESPNKDESLEEELKDLPSQSETHQQPETSNSQSEAESELAFLSRTANKPKQVNRTKPNKAEGRVGKKEAEQ